MARSHLSGARRHGMSTPNADGDDPTLEAIEFLARSPHRAAVLEALAEAPRTRHDLRERADVSRVTVRRLVDDLVDRGWITHDEGQYEATPKGRVVAREFGRLQSNLETASTLDDALQWLPTDAFDFDLARLRDADVLRASSWQDHTASVTHAVELARETTAIRGTAIGFTHEVVDVIRELTVSDEGSFEAVVDEPTLAFVREDPGLRDRFRAILESENGALYRYTGETPLHMVMRFDDTTVICGHVDEGPPPGTLETDDLAVFEWARSYFESALEQSEPVAADRLAAGQPDTS